MHDIDRTQLELPGVEAGLAPTPGEMGESGLGSQEAMEIATETPFNELQEVELATELLEVSNEQELQQFLGNLVSKAGKAVGAFVRSDTGQALGGILRDAAKKALPVIGRGVGQWVSPERGGQLGAAAGRWLGQALGLELEGLSQEDREFETARQLVRFLGAAVRHATLLPATSPPALIAQRAAAAAARAYAPGLLQLPGRSSLAWPRSGRWVRRGKTIVLYGG